MTRLAIDGGSPVRSTRLGYGHQSIDESDRVAVDGVLRSDFLTCGPDTCRFEKELGKVVDAPFVTAVANGTAALHVACLAADIKQGDEVIVSPITFAASANCVLYCGGKPVFADIDPRTWNISPEDIEKKLTERTKAVVVVDFSGVPADLDPIRQLCDDYRLVLIEDAAHSLGSYYHHRPVGSIADMTTFSFHPVKTITTGEGGAVSSLRKDLAAKIALFAKHGITRDESLMTSESEGPWYYEQLELGYNYRMSDLQAALGISQLARLSTFAKRRREIVSMYDDAFSSMSCLSVQYDPTPQETVRHLYCLRFDLHQLGCSRRFIFDALRAEGIGANVHYIPVYRLPYYRRLGYDAACCLEANKYYEEAITLPLHCCMDDKDVGDVICAVEKVIENLRCNEVHV